MSRLQVRVFIERRVLSSIPHVAGALKGLLVAVFPKLTYLSALIISACLTPTDPILAAAIVGGHYADKNASLSGLPL